MIGLYKSTGYDWWAMSYTKDLRHGGCTTFEQALFERSLYYDWVGFELVIPMEYM